MTHSSVAVLLSLGLLAAPLTPASAHDDDAAASKAPLKLGKVTFQNTCSKAAQPKFERSVALLHSFWFNEAEKSFREVLAQDPSCAIANWGIATVRIGNTFAGNATPADAKVAQEAIALGRAIGAKSEREKGYIDAVAAYWDNYAQPHGARMQALSKSFEALAARLPQDDEAQIFSAIYLTAIQSPTDKTFGPTLKAAGMLEPLLVKYPEHPGVAHYLIHSYDYPSIAAKGVPAAKRYAQIAPSAPHALHMPSHIFTRVGAWQESAETNRRSADTAVKEKSPGDQLHALDYFVYANLQLARDNEARAAIEEARKIGNLNPDARQVWYAVSAMPARYAVERGSWKEAAGLEPISSKYAFATAMTLYAKALGAARSGDLATADAATNELGEIAKNLRQMKDEYWATEVRVQYLGAQAWSAFAAGKRDEALALMREAATLEDTSEKNAVSPGRLIPARELLGDMLMEIGKPSDALAEYEQSQVRDPNRLRGLYGAGLAASQAGDKAKAQTYFRRVSALAGGSNARPELGKVKAFLSAN
jgi:tetratricopeptide (TPR) repeat protein